MGAVLIDDLLNGLIGAAFTPSGRRESYNMGIYTMLYYDDTDLHGLIALHSVNFRVLYVLPTDGHIHLIFHPRSCLSVIIWILQSRCRLNPDL